MSRRAGSAHPVALLLILLAVPLLAGCASAPEAAPPPVPGARDAPSSRPEPVPAEADEPRKRPSAEEGPAASASRFGAPVVALAECPVRCYEPSVAVDREGRIFVSEVYAQKLAVSLDDGRSFEPLAPPPLPPGAPPDSSRSDALLQTDALGRLYLSALVSSRPRVSLPTGIEISSVPVIHGVQVARTDDGGRTWAANALLWLGADPEQPLEAVDRQWLGFGRGDVVYVSYSQVPTGIWAARSDDAGESWSAPVRALPLEGRVGVGQAGAPVVDSEGRVFLAALSATSPDPAAQGAPGVQVARSDDDGATWSIRHAWSSGSALEHPLGFAMLAAGPDGRLDLAWLGPRAEVMRSTSTDHGESWLPAERLTRDGEQSLTAPWIARTPGGGFEAVWHAQEERAFSVVHARVANPAGAPLHRVVAGGIAGGDGNTHVASFALGPDGWTVVVWATEDETLVSSSGPAEAPTPAAACCAGRC